FASLIVLGFNEVAGAPPRDGGTTSLPIGKREAPPKDAYTTSNPIGKRLLKCSQGQTWQCNSKGEQCKCV
ncbi:hypothetical protein PMAYCL1PPCAC_22067, partial [Pristionchus mayeri]